MTLARPGRGSLVWLGALVLTLGVLLADSRERLESIREISSHRLTELPEPEPDPGSPSGYAQGQHRAILPAIDAYHWILQTERMLDGGGWRIRAAAYDDAPGGREVHWSGLMRWWGGGLAVAYAAASPGLSRAQALERVAPWANTALLVVFLLAFTPLFALRLGALPAAFFAMGSVAVFPFYEYFVVGYFDHHGVAAMCGLLSVLLLAAGGGGWVREREGAALSWLPDLRSARLWFVASAAASAVGLWVSAATLVPVLLGIGGGAALAALLARGATIPVGCSTRPGLWRLWGLAGGVLSLGFYLLEYFPSHLGIRLEVNHPLYAFAWVGGGGLLCRLHAGPLPGTRVPSGSLPLGAWILPDILAILLVPAVILLAGDAVFRLADPFLYTLHERFIVEFLPLGPRLAAMSPRVVAGRASVLPLIALPLAAVLWPTGVDGVARAGSRAALLVAVGVAMAYAHLVLRSLLGERTGLVLVGDGVLLGSGFALGLRPAGRAMSAPSRAVLLLVLAPAVLLLALSLVQVRWVGVSAGLWLAVLVVAAALLRREQGLDWTGPRRAVVGMMLAASFLAAPALILPLPLDRSDPPQELARDASWWLRRHVGRDSAVVFTSPNATTWTVYFGGFRGVGTLYWENLEGLRSATAIANAPTADSLRVLLGRRGVTHLVLFPWDSGLELLRRAQAESVGSSLPGMLPRLAQDLRGAGTPSLPPWLVPLAYPAPPSAVLGHPSALILEVVPDQPPELSLVRLAQYYQAVGAPAQTEAALRASVQLRSSVAAWALLAQVEASRGGARLPEALTELRGALREGGPVDPGDRLNAVIALAVGRDGPGAVRELQKLLAAVDERALRRLSPEALSILVQLAQQLGLDRAYPEAVALAESLVWPSGPEGPGGR